MLTDTLFRNDVTGFPFDKGAPRLAMDQRPRFGRNHDRKADRNLPLSRGQFPEGIVHPAVEVCPPDSVKRRTTAWHGMAAEFIQSTTHERIDYSFHAPVHLLAVCEQGVRREGETYVEGLPRSTLRHLTRKLTFAPAGHAYCEWQEPRTLTSVMYFYIDPEMFQVHSDFDISAMSFRPRLLFEDTTLWDTALKLKRSIDSPTLDNRLYSEALGVVLVHELVRINRGTPRAEPRTRGGLAAWHQRIVAAYIEEHLAEPIALATLAQLVGLSPYHFCRAFKQSFGMPPHRYHTSRRIERGKMLLANDAVSVTDIGLTLGFSETSSFTAAFRNATGLTPTGYRRSVG